MDISPYIIQFRFTYLSLESLSIEAFDITLCIVCDNIDAATVIRIMIEMSAPRASK